MKGWKALFDEEKEVTDIAGKVSELEKEYKKWDWINTSLIFLGFGIILCSLGGSRMIQNILLGSGIIVAITGLINIAVLKIWMHVKISMYQLMVEFRKSK
jgi:hypothetical protein